jgi:hypothetical protein
MSASLFFGRLGHMALLLLVVSLVVFGLQARARIDPARKALTIGGAG